MAKKSKRTHKFVENKNGPRLGYSPDSGVSILEVDGLYFKDLNKNGKLDPYEDWRLPVEERIADLVKRLTIEEIAGLMLYSKHQAISTGDDIFSKMFAGTYDGKPLEQSGKDISDLTDEQVKFLVEDAVRHVLITVVDSPLVAAKWNNNAQSLAEESEHGIPVNISTDPRHTPVSDAEFNAGAGGSISYWPEPLGLAATFSPEIVEDFGKIAACEYRALGISTALSPQIDLATDPRWMRFSGTFGEDTKLATDLARAYIDGFQGREGWGNHSVNAMVKHWPGGGSGEGGRDAHFRYGKFAVYPGDNFEEHMIPFVKGAFELKGQTKKASAVMPYYTISYGQDEKYGENVGNSYSKYIIQDLLRDKYKYDGVVCTDWLITQDNVAYDSFLSGKCWGVEELSEAERHYRVLMAGVDQFGGNNDKIPVLQAYEMGVAEHGEKYMRERLEQSARRLLRNIFNTGLFENPYLDPKESEKIVGNPEYMKAGFEAQKKSVVMLKNKDRALPIIKGSTVYIPKRRMAEAPDWFGNIIPAHEQFPVKRQIVENYYKITNSPEQADFALVFIQSPKSQSYTKEKGFMPVTLQYRPYQAVSARTQAIANEEGEDRSYKNKWNTPSNYQDLDIVLETVESMSGRPVIVVMNTSNPAVVAEFEGLVDAILLEFNVQTQAVLDLISGKDDFQACLPFQMPKDMETVETQYEDKAHDMECHLDSEGNTYDFGFGLGYKGKIINKYNKGGA